MPGPSERKRLERIEEARKAVAEKVVRICERRRLRGEPIHSFTVRIAPTKGEYAKGKAGCGGYDPRDAESREVFLAVVSDLEHSCGIDVKRDPTGAPESLVINEAAARYAYRAAGRSLDDAEEAARLLGLLESTARACADVPWALAWIDRIAADAKRPGGLLLLRERYKEGVVEDVCAALQVYAAGDFRGWQRVLSVAAYGDSKHFETSVASSFVKAAETGGFSFDPSLDADGKLSALGFHSEKYHCVAIGGNVVVRPAWGAIDLSAAGGDGLALSLSAVEGFVESSCDEVRACVVVENLANFRVLCREAPRGLLVVWGHGRPNEAVCRLVELLDAALPSAAPLRAWSDIDTGGFGIVSKLMSLSARMQPLMMGEEELRAVGAAHLLKRSDGYWDDMARSFVDKGGSCFREAASICLDFQGTFEQEALLFAYASEKIARLLGGED